MMGLGHRLLSSPQRLLPLQGWRGLCASLRSRLMHQRHESSEALLRLTLRCLTWLRLTWLRLTLRCGFSQLLH